MISVIAARYANALVDVVTEPNSGLDPKLVGEQLSSISAAMLASPELRSVMMSPAVPKKKKKALIGKVADEMAIPTKVKNFLYLAIDRGRIVKLPEIREAYDLALDEKLGFIRADIASAVELTADQRAAIEAQLSKLSGKNVKASYAVDRSLVGGVIARVGSTVYDGSIRGQLENLRKQLVAGA